MEPNADFPAQTMNRTSSTMCTPMPATALSPTAGTATAGSTPDFCRYRAFSAMPPTDAGASVPANDAATCARNVGTKRRRSGTEPMIPNVAPT